MPPTFIEHMPHEVSLEDFLPQRPERSVQHGSPRTPLFSTHTLSLADSHLGNWETESVLHFSVSHLHKSLKKVKNKQANKTWHAISVYFSSKAALMVSSYDNAKTML